jgi:hypothetical protein
VHATLDVPFRRIDDAQSAQSAATSIVHTHTLSTRASHPRARRPAPDPTPPPPCPRVAQTDPGEPVYSRARSEPEAAPTVPFHHRQPPAPRCTQRTTPHQNTALLAQSRSLETTVVRAHRHRIKTPLDPPCSFVSPFVPLHSPHLSWNSPSPSRAEAAAGQLDLLE